MTSKKVGGPTLDHNDGKDPKGGSPWNFLLIVIVSVVAFSVLAGFAGDLMYIWGGFVPGLFPLVLPCIVVLALVLSTGYVVRQQHVAVIERLGRFHGFAQPGFHVKVPLIDVAHDVDLMTEDQHMRFDAKTSDNVTIELNVSIQYHVDGSNMQAGAESGVWKSFYTLTDPVAQMKDYLADALRSQIPNRSLDEVFSEKDAIARSIEDVVAEKMLAYGYVLVTTLITSISLPAEVQNSMNRIVASKNNLESARNDAEAERAKTVIAAQAKAEAMAAEGKGIADQRVAIARGIKESIDTIRGSELTNEEANRLFEFTQWVSMMGEFAAKGPSSVVLPGDFSQSRSMFDQMMAAKSAPAPQRDEAAGRDWSDEA